MVAHPSKVSAAESAAIFVLGICFLALNYWVDLQKEVFKLTKGKCYIWGKQAKAMVSEASFKK